MVERASGAASEHGPSTLGELLLALSRVTSAGLGLGTDHGIRTCYIAMALAEELDLPATRIAELYYAALAKDGGCTCGASQLAQFLDSDDREALDDLFRRDADSELEMLRWLFRHAGRGHGPATRTRRVLAALVHGQRFDGEASLEECEVAQRLAGRLHLGPEIVAALGACTERWDGKGQPHGLAGEEIPIAARITNLGAAVEISERFSGRDAAIALVQRRSGTSFDPAVADAFLAIASREDFWAELSGDDLIDRIGAAEPVDGRLPGGAEALDAFTEVVADLVDLKRPASAGHARRVADLSNRLAERLGLPVGDGVTLRRAAMVHDAGLMTLSAAALARGDDGAAYRAHPRETAYFLDDAPSLRAACEIASLHHERVDGSGFPAGVTATHQPVPARILAVVCAFDEQTDGDPQRYPEAVRGLSTAPGLDRDVLDALAAEIGQPAVAAAADRPAGLTEREVEVLRLAARGLSVRTVAEDLVISRHTVRHHLENAYAKIGVSTRAAAALFATEHGLLD